MRRRRLDRAEQIRVAAELERFAAEHLGLSADDPVRRRIRRLQKVWDTSEFKRIRCAIANLRATRTELHRIGVHVPPIGVLDGDLLLGEAPTPHYVATPVCLQSFRLLLGTLIIGLIGAGKTTACRRIVNLVAELLPHVHILLFDPNRSYVETCHNPRLWLNTPWHDISINPLRAPNNYPYEQWINLQLDVLSRGELLHSRYLLAQRLQKLFKAATVPRIDDGACLPPTLYELRDDLANHRCRPGSREEAYRESALNVLDGRLRTSGAIYDCCRGQEDILTRSRVRIDVEGISPIESYRFLLTNLIHYAFRRRCVEPLLEPPELHTLIVIEEAQTLLKSREDSPLSLYQELLLKSRSLGIGYVFVTQDVSRIDPIVLAGMSNFFVFAQASAEDKLLVQRLLDLAPRETALLGELQSGECFGKFVSHSHWPYPFVMKVKAS